jgi:hypothetical protein
MGLLTTTPQEKPATIGIFRLREPFAQWPQHKVIRVVNAHLWPPIQTLADQLGDDETWDGEFDAGLHAEIERVMNRPPPEPLRPMTYTHVLESFGWTPEDFRVAISLGLPTGGGPPYFFYSQCAFWRGDINAWLERIHAFVSTLPKTI